MALPQNEALSELSRVIEHARPRLARVIENFEIPPEDADDILQDATLSMLAQWDKVRSPEAWLIGATKKKCIMYWRKRRGSLADAVDKAILELLEEPIINEGSAKEELTWDLHKLLENLPPRCRQLLKLRYGLGYGPSEAAALLGYHASSIRKVTNRCIAALTRQIMARGFLKQSSTEE